ncbi:MAG: UvrD-helicase domain-containing protein, partial [Acidobacteriota bacterium]
DEALRLDWQPGDAIAGTKVRSAVAWLERAGFVERAENRTRVFQGKLRVRDLAEAEARLRSLPLDDATRRRWRAILGALVAADPEEGYTADALAELPAAGFDGVDAGRAVMRTLADMTTAGLLDEGLQLVVHLDPVKAPKALGRLARAERELLAALQHLAPDADDGAWQELSIRGLNQHLLDQDVTSMPIGLRRVLDGLAGLVGHDSRTLIEVRARSKERYRVRLAGTWDALYDRVAARSDEATVVLRALVDALPPNARRGRQRVAVGLEDLVAALRSDLVLAATPRELEHAERALLHLHEQEVVHLQNGLAVFRQAMTLRLQPAAHGRRLGRRHVEPLLDHYAERDFQIHAIDRYARLAAERLEEGWELVRDYFTQPKDAFVARYFPGQDSATLQRPTGDASWRRIVELGNPEQERVVTAPVDADLLVLAGPGSGKTKVVVHRCAYLLRVARVPARSIVVLCFNRNAALELRHRLRSLVGEDARGVTVTTYHGMALRLVGHSFATESARETVDLRRVIAEAVDLLRDPTGGEPSTLDADELRERLLAGTRYVLVDEYQDITADQYELVRALAQRAGEGEPARVLAVGDDDQTIYGWNGAEVAFIRRFDRDYDAERCVLSSCYRATGHILAAANALAAAIPRRLKSEPLHLDSARRDDPPGGRWASIESERGGRVQVLRVVGGRQAEAVVERLRAMRRLDPDWDWSSVLVLARRWRVLAPLRAALDAVDIPSSWAGDRERMPPLGRIREIARVVDRLRAEPSTTWTPEALGRLEADVNAAVGSTPWRRLLHDAFDELAADVGDRAIGSHAVLTHVFDLLGEQR